MAKHQQQQQEYNVIQGEMERIERTVLQMDDTAEISVSIENYAAQN